MGGWAVLCLLYSVLIFLPRRQTWWTVGFLQCLSKAQTAKISTRNIPRDRGGFLFSLNPLLLGGEELSRVVLVSRIAWLCEPNPPRWRISSSEVLA